MSQSRDVAVDHDGSVTSSSLSLPQFALSESLGSLGDDPSSPSSEGRISGDGVEVVQAADGVASELPTAGNVDSAANESPWGRFSFVERAQLGFPELDPDDTLDFLGYRGRVSVHGEISNSAVEEVDEDNNNNNSNNNISNNNVNSGASSAVNEATNFRVYLYRHYENRLKEERELRNMLRESFIEKLKEVEKERDKEKEGRVNAEEELKRTKKMLEEVRKVLDDERRGREAADEPEMPEEG